MFIIKRWWRNDSVWSYNFSYLCPKYGRKPVGTSALRYYLVSTSKIRKETLMQINDKENKPIKSNTIRDLIIFGKLWAAFDETRKWQEYWGIHVKTQLLVWIFSHLARADSLREITNGLLCSNSNVRYINMIQISEMLRLNLFIFRLSPEWFDRPCETQKRSSRHCYYKGAW